MRQAAEYYHSRQQQGLRHKEWNVRFLRDGRQEFYVVFTARDRAERAMEHWRAGATQGEMAELFKSWGRV